MECGVEYFLGKFAPQLGQQCYRSYCGYTFCYNQTSTTHVPTWTFVSNLSCVYSYLVRNSGLPRLRTCLSVYKLEVLITTDSGLGY